MQVLHDQFLCQRLPYIPECLESSPLIGELLTCQTEFGNPSDPYAVVVMYNNTSIVIGHVPRHISTVCHFFLRRNGNIICQVTGKRSYSSDLVQGRLEIPCTFTFSGTDCNDQGTKAN